jgi:hypothetical protein
MKKTILIFGLAIIILPLITGCEKKILGCTDPNSINFNSSANVNDGSCQYEGSIVFWYDPITADTLIAHKVTSLTYYVNGVVVGSSIPSISWVTPPDCGQNASVTVTEPFTGVTNLTYSFSVNDQNGIVWWNNTATFIANGCSSYQLE